MGLCISAPEEKAICSAVSRQDVHEDQSFHFQQLDESVQAMILRKAAYPISGSFECEPDRRCYCSMQQRGRRDCPPSLLSTSPVLLCMAMKLIPSLEIDLTDLRTLARFVWIARHRPSVLLEHCLSGPSPTFRARMHPGILTEVLGGIESGEEILRRLEKLDTDPAYPQALLASMPLSDQTELGRRELAKCEMALRVLRIAGKSKRQAESALRKFTSGTSSVGFVHVAELWKLLTHRLTRRSFSLGATGGARYLETSDLPDLNELPSPDPESEDELEELVWQGGAVRALRLAPASKADPVSSLLDLEAVQHAVFESPSGPDASLELEGARRHLRAMRSLRTLTIKGSLQEDLQWLGGLPALESICIKAPGEVPGLEGLHLVPSLAEIRLDTREASLAPLAALPRLRRLRVANTAAPLRAAPELYTLTQLTSLSLGPKCDEACAGGCSCSQASMDVGAVLSGLPGPMDWICRMSVVCPTEDLVSLAYACPGLCELEVIHTPRRGAENRVPTLASLSGLSGSGNQSTGTGADSRASQGPGLLPPQRPLAQAQGHAGLLPDTPNESVIAMALGTGSTGRAKPWARKTQDPAGSVVAGRASSPSGAATAAAPPHGSLWTAAAAGVDLRSMRDLTHVTLTLRAPLSRPLFLPASVHELDIDLKAPSGGDTAGNFASLLHMLEPPRNLRTMRLRGLPTGPAGPQRDTARALLHRLMRSLERLSSLEVCLDESDLPFTLAASSEPLPAPALTDGGDSEEAALPASSYSGTGGTCGAGGAKRALWPQAHAHESCVSLYPWRADIGAIEEWSDKVTRAFVQAPRLRSVQFSLYLAGYPSPAALDSLQMALERGLEAGASLGVGSAGLSPRQVGKGPGAGKGVKRAHRIAVAFRHEMV